MRIALLSWESLHSIASGGVATHVTELAAALQRLGHEAHVFTRMEEGQRYHDWIDGVHYHRCPYHTSSDLVDDVNCMCRSFVERVFVIEDIFGHFDVIHAHDWLTANAMIWVKQGRNHTSILTIHSTEYGRCGNSFPNGVSIRIREQERAGTYWADTVICVSNALKEEILWMYEVPEWKVSVIFNGVSSHRFHNCSTFNVGKTKQFYNIAPMDPTILFCGRLEWQKGPDLLIEAIPAILRLNGNSKFVFVGDGGMRDSLQRRTWQLGIEQAVRFLGFRHTNETVNLFKLTDGLCVPSRNEPFGIVILEAWSAGKPVVTTDIGGPKEFVQHEYNGLKITPNPDSIAWGLGTLLSDFRKAQWMGENGRKSVGAHFEWDNVAQKTLVAYGIHTDERATDSHTENSEQAIYDSETRKLKPEPKVLSSIIN